MAFRWRANDCSAYSGICVLSPLKKTAKNFVKVGSPLTKLFGSVLGHPVLTYEFVVGFKNYLKQEPHVDM